MEQKYTEEFELDGKNFIYIDFSGIITNDEFRERIKLVEREIVKYPEDSLYTITNAEGIRFDTESKEIAAQYMMRNKPYIRHGAVIGLDGITKVMINSIVALSGRRNIHYTFSKEQAIEWLAEQE